MSGGKVIFGLFYSFAKYAQIRNLYDQIRYGEQKSWLMPYSIVRELGGAPVIGIGVHYGIGKVHIQVDLG